MSKKFVKLNRQNMRKLLAGQKITESGITYERLKDGDGRFTVDIVVDGQRVHRVVGQESAGVTLTHVEQYIEKVRTEAREGRLRLPKGRKTHLTFSEASTKYLQREAEGNGKDLKSKMHRLRDHLVPFFGNMPLSKISSFDLDRYKKLRQVQKREIKRKIKKPDGTVETVIEYRPYQAGTINRELLTLSHILTRAIEWGWIQHRPCIIKQLKEPPSRFLYLTIEQSHRLLEAAKESTNPVLYPFIFIALHTCMRRREILSIRISDIDFHLQTIHVPKAKAGQREQPITLQLAKYLKGLLAQAKPDQEWLFPSLKSRTGHAENIEKPFRAAVKTAGLDVKEVNRHTLRHTAITHLVQAGVDLPTVQRISGHHSIDMVARYAHANGDHVRSAMDKLESRYSIGAATA